MIRVTADTAAAEAIIKRLKEGLAPERVDIVVDKVGLMTLAGIVRASPKKWFGQIRSAWAITKPFEGARMIDVPAGRKDNNAKTTMGDITRWVNFGTAGDGAGWIYPIRGPRLYIPLRREAAAGWRPGFIYGTHYVLRYRVRGQRGQHFIEPERKKGFERLSRALRKYIRGLVTGGAPEAAAV